MGGSTRMVGAVGRDASGQRMLDAFAAAGVDTSDVAALPQPTGTALIVVDRDGENQIVVCPGANSHLSLDGVEFGPEETVYSWRLAWTWCWRQPGRRKASLC
ncbi:PfkB family carbohydrate kinase [Arthrobacter sp. 162MFSha1.1]|uniref:PfkB family carbohydrate kinase n=1 Tax=Arthrobacter sp. 162MFSha1.1 TaxID=1151119 RepID=UPI002F2B874B